MKKKRAFMNSDKMRKMPDDVLEKIWNDQFEKQKRKWDEVFVKVQKATDSEFKRKYIAFMKKNDWKEGFSGQKFMKYIEERLEEEIGYERGFHGNERGLFGIVRNIYGQSTTINPAQREMTWRPITYKKKISIDFPVISVGKDAVFSESFLKKQIQKTHEELKKLFEKVYEEEKEKVRQKYPDDWENETIQKVFLKTGQKMVNSPIKMAVGTFYSEVRVFSKNIQQKYINTKIRLTKDELLDKAVEGLGNDVLEDEIEQKIEVLFNQITKNAKLLAQKLIQATTGKVSKELISSVLNKNFQKLKKSVSLAFLDLKIDEFYNEVKGFVFEEIDLKEDYKNFDELMKKHWRKIKKEMENVIFYDESQLASSDLFGDIVGSGMMDWLKNKYNRITKTPPQPQPQPQQPANIIQQANQPLPPEIPSTKVLQIVASNAYKKVGESNPVDSFQLVDATNTLKLYKSNVNPSLYILGVRGTEVSEQDDRSADLSFKSGIVGNNLKKSKRYMSDKKTLLQFLSKHGIQDSDFIVGSAHSLGGALCDELLQDRLIDYAVSFNPAVQPKDVGLTQFHRRIYLDKDPLYQTMARNNVKNNIEVRQTPETTGSKVLGSVSTTLGNLWKTKNAHSIENFVGGSENLFDDAKNMWVLNHKPTKNIDTSVEDEYINPQSDFNSKIYDDKTNKWLEGGVRYFVYRTDDDNDVSFAGKMKTEQCRKMIGNTRCKRRSMIGIEYCSSHMAQEMKLKIKTSSIPGAGDGVFAFLTKSNKEKNRINVENHNATRNARPLPRTAINIVFKKDDIIGNFEGERIDIDELGRRYDSPTQNYTAPYAMKLNNNEIIDPALKRGILGMMNTKLNDNDNNVRAKKPRNDNTIQVVAKRDIYDGEELFIYYNDDYFDNPDFPIGNWDISTKKPVETYKKNWNGNDLLTKNYYQH